MSAGYGYRRPPRFALSAQSVEWMGTATGIFGAAILAMNTGYSKWGWVLFLCSNLAWIAFSLKKRHHGLLVQQLVFAGTSILGMARYF